MRVEQFAQQDRELLIQANVGAEKITWKMKLDGQWVAAKIFKLKDLDDKIIDRDQRAREELQAYVELIKTPLKEYIPSPICLLQDRTSKDVVGLAVEWRDAVLLSDLFPQKILNSGDVNKLKELFVNFLGASKVPNTDMLNESNLMIEKIGQSAKIWFAECGLNDSIDDIRVYPRHLESMIDLLIRDYVF